MERRENPYDELERAYLKSSGWSDARIDKQDRKNASDFRKAASAGFVQALEQGSPEALRALQRGMGVTSQYPNGRGGLGFGHGSIGGGGPGQPPRELGGVDVKFLGDPIPKTPPLSGFNTPQPAPKGGNPYIPERFERYADTSPKDTSWDWARMGGSAPIDTTSGNMPLENPFLEATELGRDSPWGNPDIEGGNEDFYANQLARLSYQDQAFQNNNIASAIRREAQADQPQQSPNMDWSWANNGEGLNDVRVGTGTDQEWSLAPQWDTNTTNYDIASSLADTRGGNSGLWKQWIRDNEGNEQTNWANYGDPTKIMNNLGGNIGPGTKDAYRQMAYSVYRQNPSGDSVPAGYADTI